MSRFNSSFALSILFFATTVLAQESPCGRPSGGETVKAGDALFILQSAVGTRQCDVCVCDVDGSGDIVASDALRDLRIAVGINLSLDCMACGGDTIGNEGGIVESNDGGLELYVPPGALASDTDITITLIDGGNLPVEPARVAPVYRIEPEGTTFDVPATVVIAVAPTTAADTPVVVTTYDEIGETWEPIDGSSILAGDVVAQTSHLSTWSAVVAQNPGCDNVWSGGPGTVPPLHTVGGITVVPATKTAEDVAFSGPSEISLGSTWVSPACSVTVEGSFGPGLLGNGAWMDYSQGGSGVVFNGGGGSFSFDLTTSPPANPRGPYFGLSDPCHAPLPTYPYNLNISFAADCVGMCTGVDCNDGNPCTDDVCDPGTGNCSNPPNSATCGLSNGGLCVESLCMVEVDMESGQSGESVCASEGLACDGVPVLSDVHAACKAFHPSANTTSSVNGWKQSVFCDDNEGLACTGKTNTCHRCSACLDTGLTCQTTASTQLEKLYANCVP